MILLPINLNLHIIFLCGKWCGADKTIFNELPLKVKHNLTAVKVFKCSVTRLQDLIGWVMHLKVFWVWLSTYKLVVSWVIKMSFNPAFEDYTNHKEN